MPLRDEALTSELDAQDRRDMRRLAEGHDAALNELMERHGARLFHYLTRQLGNESEAEDCAQEAFVRVYLNRKKFQAEAKFSTWLYAIATNLARDVWRRRGRRPEVSLDAEHEDGERGRGGGLLDSVSDGKESAIEGLMREERADAVRRAVQALPEELRMPLVLFEYEDMGQAEIGEILGLSRKAVEVRIYRARLALRKALEIGEAARVSNKDSCLRPR